MDNWDVCHRVTFIGEHEENESQILSGIPKEDLKVKDEEANKTENFFMPEFKKRKRLSRSQLREMKAGLGGNQKQTNIKLKTKKHESRDRWSSER